jgi:3-phenylpropionate/trans-cinnamate dioxygenase ferredoxin subunit
MGSATRTSSRHVVGPVADLPPGTRRRIEVNGRGIAIFNDRGTFYALRDVCPHRGARLSDGTVVGSVTASGPGCYETDPARRLVKCPWHGWEFDLSTGQSWCDPEHARVRSYDVTVEQGAALATGEPVPGPYVAETVEISVEDDYVVIHP